MFTQLGLPASLTYAAYRSNQQPSSHACSPGEGSCRKVSDKSSQCFGIVAIDHPHLMSARDIDLKRALAECDIGRTLGAVVIFRSSQSTLPTGRKHDVSATSFSMISRNGANFRSFSLLWVRLVFMAYRPATCAPGTPCVHVHTQIDTFSPISLEAFLLPLLTRHIRPHDVRYRLGTVSKPSMDCQSSQAGPQRNRNEGPPFPHSFRM